MTSSCSARALSSAYVLQLYDAPYVPCSSRTCTSSSSPSVNWKGTLFLIALAMARFSAKASKEAPQSEWSVHQKFRARVTIAEETSGWHEVRWLSCINREVTQLHNKNCIWDDKYPYHLFRIQSSIDRFPPSTCPQHPRLALSIPSSAYLLPLLLAAQNISPCPSTHRTADQPTSPARPRAPCARSVSEQVCSAVPHGCETECSPYPTPLNYRTLHV